MPTMSRPQQAASVLKSIKDIGCSSKGIVFVNGTQYADEYRKLLVLPDNWQVIYHPENIGCIAALNHVFGLFPNESFYGLWGDDEFLETNNLPEWDKKILEAASEWNLAHAYEDWNHGKRFQGAAAIGGNLARAVGYLGVPTCFHHYGFDSAWEWLSSTGAFQIKLVPEVRIHHARPEVTNAEKDDCYRLADTTFAEDRNRFWDWRVNQMDETVERIRKARAG